MMATCSQTHLAASKKYSLVVLVNVALQAIEEYAGALIEATL
jgi:hypothetical protein